MLTTKKDSLCSYFLERQWRGKYLTIVSYLSESQTLEELFCLLRKKHGLFQKDIAKIINVSQQVIHDIENNKRDLRFSEILALANYHEDFRLGAIAFLEMKQLEKEVYSR